MTANWTLETNGWELNTSNINGLRNPIERADRDDKNVPMHKQADAAADF